MNPFLKSRRNNQNGLEYCFNDTSDPVVSASGNELHFKVFHKRNDSSQIKLTLLPLILINFCFWLRLP